jgi:mannose-6-phosphate isomerase-like protein (cupin superfamily)
VWTYSDRRDARALQDDTDPHNESTEEKQMTTQPTISQPTTGLPSTSAPYVLATDEGDHRHLLNHLATTKVDAGESGSMAAVEFSAPRGFGPPLHVHHGEDEVMIVLDGEVAFRSGDDEQVATAGATVYLPHGVPHTFQVLSESARFTTVAARLNGAPLFGQFVAELGDDLDQPVTPAPVDIDPAAVAEAGARHGLTILGPPPAPLD